MDQQQTPISITLSTAQWDTLVNLLAEAPAPYKVTAPLIAEIMRQAQAQTGHAAMEARAGLPPGSSPPGKQTPGGTPGASSPRPNGADIHPS